RTVFRTNARNWLTRRGFVTGGLAIAGLAVLQACAPAAVPTATPAPAPTTAPAPTVAPTPRPTTAATQAAAPATQVAAAPSPAQPTAVTQPTTASAAASSPGTLTLGFGQKTSFSHFMHLRHFSGSEYMYVKEFTTAKLVNRSNDLTQWVPALAD